MKLFRILMLRVVAAIAVVLVGGCATDGSGPETSQVAHATKHTPSTDVHRVQAWKDAEMVSSLGTGRASAAGAGESMQPIYGENTMLVITPIAFEELQPGMSVAYLNHRGRRVVHQLIAKETSGWRVRGLNNEAEDRERVTRENLLGVIYASFATDEGL